MYCRGSNSRILNERKFMKRNYIMDETEWGNEKFLYNDEMKLFTWLGNFFLCFEKLFWSRRNFFIKCKFFSQLEVANTGWLAEILKGFPYFHGCCGTFSSNSATNSKIKRCKNSNSKKLLFFKLHKSVTFETF